MKGGQSSLQMHVQMISVSFDQTLVHCNAAFGLQASVVPQFVEKSCALLLLGGQTRNTQFGK